MSTHAIEIIEINQIEPHPNPEAERLEITHIWGWQCCIGKGQFKPNDKAIYIPPDFEVPLNRPEFAFLKRAESRDYERIKVRRFKGAYSQGLLIPLPAEMANLPVGSNVMETLGIRRYEPLISLGTEGENLPDPVNVYAPKFDVENYARFTNIFQLNESVVVTEKIHGANCRFVYAQNQQGEWMQFVGGRSVWLKELETIVYWQALKQNPGISAWCQANPGKVLYGEVFGKVQILRYGVQRNEVFFCAFAILDKTRWLDYEEAVHSIAPFGIKWAPLVYLGPFDPAKILPLAEGDSRWPGANHLAEGIVIIPIHERMHEEIGRVCLKVVSNRYLEKY